MRNGKVANGVSFHVHKPVMIPVHALNPSPYNPQKMTPFEFDALKASIRKNGFVEPLVVRKTGMAIIGGHHRARAVKEICVEDARPLPELPAVVLDVDDRAARRLNIALNRIHGSPDARLLAELLDGMNDDHLIDDDEALLMGFEKEDVDKYLKLVNPEMGIDHGKEIDSFGRSVTLSLEFADIKHRDAVKKALQERAEVEKKPAGEVVYGMLSGTKKKRALS